MMLPAAARRRSTASSGNTKLVGSPFRYSNSALSLSAANETSMAYDVDVRGLEVVGDRRIRCWPQTRANSEADAGTANAPPCLATIPPIRRNNVRSEPRRLAAAGLPRPVGVPIRPNGSVAVVTELTTKTTIRRTPSSSDGMPARCSASIDSSVGEHASHADVVGNTAVHEMDVRAVGAVGECQPFVDLALRTRSRQRRQSGPGQELQRAWHHVIAGAAVIVERDGRQHDRHRRGGGCGARQPEVVEIGTQRVEDVLVEDHAGPGRDDRSPTPG